MITDDKMNSIFVYFDKDTNSPTCTFYAIRDIWNPISGKSILDTVEKEFRVKLRQMNKLPEFADISPEPHITKLDTEALLNDLLQFLSILKNHSDVLPPYYMQRLEGKEGYYRRYKGKIGSVSITVKGGFDCNIYSEPAKPALIEDKKPEHGDVIRLDDATIHVEKINLYDFWGEELNRLIGILRNNSGNFKRVYISFV